MKVFVATKSKIHVSLLVNGVEGDYASVGDTIRTSCSTGKGYKEDII